jgi:peptide/nickel transport system substrate-binding protein
MATVRGGRGLVDPLSRRGVLGLWASLAGAAALAAACGGSKKEESGGVKAEIEQIGTRAEAGQDVIKAGVYNGPIPPSKEEQDPLKHAKRGGAVTYLSLDPPHLDMSRSQSCTVYNVNDMVYNKLVRAKVGPLADPYKIELEGDLAESWQVSPDNKEWIFKIRQGVRFHNVEPVKGRELTVEDVKLNLERYKASPAQKDIFELMDRVEIVDRSTVRVLLKQGFAGFAGSIATFSFIIPKELMEGNLAQQKAVGTGPFVLQEWTPKQGVTYTRNPDYWEKGYPFVERATMRVIPDTAAALAAYRAKEVDIGGGTTATKEEITSLVRADPDTVVQVLATSRGGNVNGLQFNLKNKMFQDIRVRRALSMAIDRKGIADTLYDGRGQGFSSPAIPWVFAFDKEPTLADQGPWYQYKPDEARRLLREAGVAGTKNVDFVYWYQRTTAPLIQQMWKDVGFEINLREVDNPTHIQLLNNYKWDDTIGIVWGSPHYEVDGWVYPFYKTGGGLNYNYVADPDLDRLLEAQRLEGDPTKRKAILKQIWDHLHDKVYEVWWPQNYTSYNWRSYVRNYRIHAFMGTTGCYTTGNMLRQIWIDKS